mmetsp:Transcript_4132/g.13223  ORF Transcript_4132/g.13223 Transcript_4132/m.13223 type:complete len:228 (+) Transcript_4132:200-883(+)
MKRRRAGRRKRDVDAQSWPPNVAPSGGWMGVEWPRGGGSQLPPPARRASTRLAAPATAELAGSRRQSVAGVQQQCTGVGQPGLRAGAGFWRCGTGPPGTLAWASLRGACCLARGSALQRGRACCNGRAAADRALTEGWLRLFWKQRAAACACRPLRWAATSSGASAPCSGQRLWPTWRSSFRRRPLGRARWSQAGEPWRCCCCPWCRLRGMMGDRCLSAGRRQTSVQ